MGGGDAGGGVPNTAARKRRAWVQRVQWEGMEAGGEDMRTETGVRSPDGLG